MKTNIVSNERARQLFNADGAKQSGPSNAERESAQQFERLGKVVAWLREHGHGGCIILPLPLSQMNRPRHHMVTAKLRKQYSEYCTLILNSRLMPAPPETMPAHATIEVQYYVFSRMDSDNLASCNKGVLDFLKGRYIVDDSDKHLSVTMLPQIVDRACPRVCIRLVAAHREAPPEPSAE